MTKRDQPNLPGLGARLAMMREVLRLRRAERLLREENNELADARDDFAELYDLAPLPLLTLGPQSSVRSANLAAAELFERERSWLVGRSFRMLFPRARPRRTDDVFGREERTQGLHGAAGSA
jgi:PAS domain-containing protein